MKEQIELGYIRQILDGDTRLFGYFLQNYADSIFILIQQIVHNREHAEEITQDVFLKAFQKLSTFKGDCQFSS